MNCRCEYILFISKDYYELYKMLFYLVGIILSYLHFDTFFLFFFLFFDQALILHTITQKLHNCNRN